MQSNKHPLLFLLLILMGSLFLSAQEDLTQPLPIDAEQDSIQAENAIRVAVRDSVLTDSTAADSLPGRRSLLDGKIKYKAKDYVRINQKEQKIYLYNEAEIYYLDTELKAGVIIMDYVKNEVYAGRIKDSLGNYTQLPYFKQGENVVIPDSIRFNYDTEKALIWNSRTEQQAGLGQLGSDNMKVYAELTKKENDSVYFLSEGKLTTSNDTINPDYYIRVRKAKFVPKKKVIAGFSNIYIADVPTPVALPFAYFPLTTGRSAGIMMPTFGNDPDRGYFLQNGGYYLPFSEYADLTLTGDLYSNGSYGFRAQSVYAKRYKFRGNVNFRFENLITSQKGFDDFSRGTIFNLQMSHNQDAKSNPNSRFSASVNIGSSQYFRSSLLQQNLPNTQINNLSSSISYSKTFPAYPSVNFSLTASHNQNTNTEVVDLTLPTLQASMDRVFPLAKRDGIKKGAIQNINFQYDLNARNSIRTTTEEFGSAEMFDNAKTGARHRIPLSTNFKVAKFFSFTVGGTYEDVWAFETFNQRFDSETEQVVTDTIRGFDRYNQYNLSANVGTTLYGTFNFGEDKKIQAIRHIMRPSISYGIAPSFEQFYDEYVNTVTGQTVQFSRFQNTVYGAPRLGRTNSMSFSLANTLEAKVRDKDSTVIEPKKIPLLSQFNLSTGYNFEADSLQLSPVSITGGTAILDQKMNINFGASLDPYALDNTNRRINTFNINNGGSLFRLTSARLNIGYRIDSKIFQRDREEEEDLDDPYSGSNYVATSGGRTDDLFGQAENLNRGAFDDRDPADVKNPAFGTKIPWNLSLQYAMTYSNSTRQNEISNSSLMFSGNIELTPNWQVGLSSGFDFVNQGFTVTQFRFARDLGSFNMTFNWTPFGEFQRWSFFIGIKSSILQDLKYEDRSQPPPR
ncbi:MAG: putative LPS assembly protein LptD [Flavobacteriaceae bacterium]